MNFLGLRGASPPRPIAGAIPAPVDVNAEAVKRAIAAGKFGPDALNSDQVRDACVAEKIQGYLVMDTLQQRLALLANHERKNQTPPLDWQPAPRAGEATPEHQSGGGSHIGGA